MLSELPPSTPNSSADEEEIDMVKAIEEAVAGALDEFGPDVADWDVEFAEEMLWVPINSPVTTTQEASSREEANQLKGPDKADKDLQHHFEASNLSSKDSDLGFSLKSERTLPMSAGPGTGEKPPRETESLNLEVDGVLLLIMFNPFNAYFLYALFVAVDKYWLSPSRFLLSGF